jgi:hypothetical protein
MSARRPSRIRRAARRLTVTHDIDVDSVDRIAGMSDAIVRNHAITIGYWHLGRSLARVLGSEHANWCTWATWASRTVGHALDPREHPLLVVERTQRWPRWLRRFMFAIARASRSVLNPRMAPAIARGNQEIFAEIGVHFAALVDLVDRDGVPTPESITAFIDSVELAVEPGSFAAGFADQHRRGLRAYLEAVGERDAVRRAELILLGNLLMAEYEQARLQPWIDEAFFVRSDALRGWRRWAQRRIGRQIARLTTRFVTAVVTPSVLIPVAEPLRMPRGSSPYVTTKTFPELEATIARLEPPNAQVCDLWPDYPQRMASIATLFRCYHAEASLDGLPYTDAAFAAFVAEFARREIPYFAEFRRPE